MPDTQKGRAAKWIFISYRRIDTGGYAESLYLALKKNYGDVVFFDGAHIDSGADFPSRLETAVKAARLVIVVIGRDWLSIVNERASKPEVDYVRREVALALARRRLAREGEPLAVLSVLVGNATPFDVQRLDVSLRDDLGDLPRIQALPVRPIPDRDNDLKALYEAIRPVCASLPEVHAAQDELTERLRAEVAAVLAQAHMADISKAWGNDPLRGRRPDEAHALLVGLYNAIRAAQASWAQPGAALVSSQVPLVKDACCELVALLYRLAVDVEAVRAWQQEGDTPAPVEQPGSAAVVAAVAQGTHVRASPKSRGSTFLADRTIDLDNGLDAGIGEDRVKQAFEGFWAMAFKAEAPSAATGVSDADLRRLRNRMTSLALSDNRPFGVTAVVGTADQHVSLRRLCERLAVRAYARTGEPEEGRLLSVEEGLLADGLCLCLEQLEKM